MTPKEASIAFQALAREVGPSADIYVSIASCAGKQGALSASVYPSGLTKGGDFYFRVEADEFEPLLDAVRAKWAEHKDVHRKQAVRKIALAIIDLTRDFGGCTEAALRGRGFTARDIAAYGADAVTEANAMADAGPFSIAKAPAANMPEGGIDDADRVLQ